MTSHAQFVWEKYVKPSRFKKLYIVAHSAGGACLACIQKEFCKYLLILFYIVIIESTFYTDVDKVALTDSWTIDKHSLTKD